MLTKISKSKPRPKKNSPGPAGPLATAMITVKLIFVYHRGACKNSSGHGPPYMYIGSKLQISDIETCILKAGRNNAVLIKV